MTGITVDKTPPEKPARKIEEPITIKIDKPAESNNPKKIPSRYVSPSGVEYIYIPLKGPLLVDTDAITTASICSSSNPKTKLREVKSVNYHSR